MNYTAFLPKIVALLPQLFSGKSVFLKQIVGIFYDAEIPADVGEIDLQKLIALTKKSKEDISLTDIDFLYPILRNYVIHDASLRKFNTFIKKIWADSQETFLTHYPFAQRILLNVQSTDSGNLSLMLLLEQYDGKHTSYVKINEISLKKAIENLIEAKNESEGISTILQMINMGIADFFEAETAIPKQPKLLEK